MKYLTYKIDQKADNNPVFAGIGGYDGFKFNYFNDILLFFDFFLTKRFENSIFFAHHGGKFDARHIIYNRNYLLNKDYKIKAINIAQNLILTVSRKKSKWTFADSYLILPAELEYAAKTFNVRHQVFRPAGKFKNNNTDIDKAYNRNYIQALYESLSYFFKIITVKKNKMTISSCVLEHYKNVFFNFKKDSKVLDGTMEDLVRESYKGGRFQVFKPFLKEGFFYDINSAYPSVMASNLMPAGPYYRVTKRNTEKIGFYRAKVFSPPGNLDLLCIKERNKGIDRLVFKSGYFDGAFVSCELDKLKSIGGEYEIIEGIEFINKIDMFSGFVKHFYNMKIKAKYENNESMYFLAKQILVSLYGKFGQKRDVEALYILDEDDKKIKEMDYVFDSELSIYAKRELNRSRSIMPQISSYITALLRCDLFDILQNVGYNNIYYTACDCIFTDKEVICKNAGKLGELEFKGFARNMTFNDINDYNGFINNNFKIAKAGTAKGGLL